MDPINPRLDDGKQTQREALQAMLAAQGDKLVVLARDIAHNGLNPLDRFLIIEAEDSQDEYVVLEGNRRLTALKLLLNPELASGFLSAANVRALKALSPSSEYRADSEMDCVLVESRDQAIHWLRLRHGGQLDGAGTVDWGATERDRFESRSGKSSPELKLLQFAVAHKAITPDDADLVSITNLRRLLSDKSVRDAVGLDIDRKAGRIATRYPVKEVLKPVRKLLSDLASDDFVVGKIYTKADRADYLSGFKRANRPDAKTKRPAAADLPASPTATTRPASTSTRLKGGGRVKARRKTVAPTGTSLKIGQKRLKDIYRELQRLRLEEHANAGAVLLRVFLELTVDHYMHGRTIPDPPRPTLANKLMSVHDHLLQSKTITKAELAPVRKAASGKDLMAASIPLFNLYVHELNLTPSPGDVRTAWDNLELFFCRIWV
ncbi:MAG TPA: hypothetical protein VFS30_10005 [Dehalococcoidia bacterium]|nr:hypothetical protein [Dehalococcoidia bacterium]